MCYCVALAMTLTTESFQISKRLKHEVCKTFKEVQRKEAKHHSNTWCATSNTSYLLSYSRSAHAAYPLGPASKSGMPSNNFPPPKRTSEAGPRRLAPAQATSRWGSANTLRGPVGILRGPKAQGTPSPGSNHIPSTDKQSYYPTCCLAW